MEALECVHDHYSLQRGAATPLVQKERMLRDFLSLDDFSSLPWEKCPPDFKTLAKVVLISSLQHGGRALVQPSEQKQTGHKKPSVQGKDIKPNDNHLCRNKPSV